MGARCEYEHGTPCLIPAERACYGCFRWYCPDHRGTSRCCPECSVLLAHCSCDSSGCDSCALRNLDGFEVDPALQVEAS